MVILLKRGLTVNLKICILKSLSIVNDLPFLGAKNLRCPLVSSALEVPTEPLAGK